MKITNTIKSVVWRFVRKHLLANYRRGFATNSSSSHSFVYLKDIPEDAHKKAYYDPAGEYYGWDDFKLSSIMDKVFYVMSQKVHGWESMDEDEKQRIREEFPEADDDMIRAASESDVDHESFGVVTPEIARNPYTVVFGGNDNDGYSRERSKMVSSGLVDWTKTEPEWGDMESQWHDPKSPLVAEMIQGLREQGWSDERIEYELDVNLGEDA